MLPRAGAGRYGGYITGLTGLPLTGWPAIRPSVRLRSANRMAGVMILRMRPII